MTTGEPRPSRRGPRRSRTQVQWVELYTHQSLYVLLWFIEGSLLLSLLPGTEEDRDLAVAFTLAAVLLTATAMPALRVVLQLHPASGPVPWRPLLPLLLTSAVVLSTVPLLPPDLRAGAALLVWLPLVWSLSGLRSRTWTAFVVVCSTAVPAVSGSPAVAVVGLLGGLFVLFTVRVSLWMEDVVRQLDRARGAQAALAVAEERLRFSRDVHDVLGRRLAAMAVQSELAATLASRGDGRAAEMMLEVRAVAHEALKEARDLARGYRASHLPTELEGAASLLRSAGIDLEVDVDGLPEERSEAAAWVVREAVTNVLRHSSARRVSVCYEGTALVVRNDGVAGATRTGPGTTGTTGSTGPAGGTVPTVDAGTGSGLVGLAERLRPLGGGVEACTEGELFVLRADLGATTAVRP